MLEFTGKKYLALVKPKVFPMVLVLDGSSEIGDTYGAISVI